MVASVAWGRRVAAQAQPEGAKRVWIELGLGASRQDPYCAGCVQQSRMGGPAVTGAIGLTLTNHFGLALAAREFSEFSFEQSHSATYFLALAQYTLAPPLRLNVGLGTSSQHGDHAPYGDNGTGSAVTGGFALRLPTNSTFGLTLEVDWIKTVSGTLRTASGLPGSSYRPMLFTIGVGINLADDPTGPPSP